MVGEILVRFIKCMSYLGYRGAAADERSRSRRYDGQEETLRVARPGHS